MSDNKVTPELATRHDVLSHISVGAGKHNAVPAGITISSNGVLFMNFDTIDELLAWAKVVGAEPYQHRQVIEGGKLFSYYTFSDLMGYHGVLTCNEDASAAEPIRGGA